MLIKSVAYNCQIKVESRHNQDNFSDDITYVGETSGGGAGGDGLPARVAPDSTFYSL